MSVFPITRVLAGLGVFVFLLATQILQVPDLPGIALQGYDELFQLALGLKTMHGDWPGLDFFTNYGPGVSVVSALSWFAGNPILAEVLVGTGLLAVGLFAFWRAGYVVGRPLHNVCLLLGLVFLAPSWPKYYYVLWPGLFLLALRDPADGNASRSRFVIIGLLVGLGGWFRIEIGLALSVALAGALVVRWRARPTGESIAALAGWAVVGALIPWLTYFGLAWVARGQLRGPGDLLDFYWVSTFAKAVDFHWVSARPRLVGFFGAYSLSGWFAVVFAAGAIAVVALCYPRASSGLGHMPLARRAWAAGWLLLCLLPQAMHRFDLMHILQVTASGVVMVSLGLAALRDAGERLRPAALHGLRLAGPVLLVVMIVLAGRLYWKTTLPPASVVARVRSLARGLEALDPASVDMTVVAAARARLASVDTILVPSIDTRMVVLVGRPFGGLFPHWSFRLPERWQERQLAALRAKPAALVLLADYYRRADPGSHLRPLDFTGRNPRLDDFISGSYSNVVHETSRWRVLAPTAQK